MIYLKETIKHIVVMIKRLAVVRCKKALDMSLMKNNLKFKYTSDELIQAKNFQISN